MVGKRVTASPGRWSASGRVTYRYQWYRCDTMGGRCTMLRGVTGRSRALSGNDVGHTLSLAVRATDSAGSTTAYASLIGPVGGAAPLLVSTVQPAIFGAAEQGGTVKVDTGSWRPRPASFSYQWARCNGKGRSCAPISGATADSHEVGADDLGHTLVAIVQARSGATSQAVFSAATLPVGALSPSPPCTRPRRAGPRLHRSSPR